MESEKQPEIPITIENLNTLNSLLIELRKQVNNEYEYAKILMVFSSTLCAKNGEIFLQRQGNEISGIATTNEDTPTPKLDALYVPEKYRKKGIGYSLSIACLKSLIKKGFQEVKINAISRVMKPLVEKLQNQFTETIKIIPEYSEHLDY